MTEKFQSFRGLYRHNIDNSGRIVVPQKFRDGLKGKTGSFVLTRGIDGDILLCPERFFKRIEKKAKKSALNSPLRFFLMSGCADATVDKQGRIIIPPDLRKDAGMETTQECVYTGSIDYVQLWSAERHNAYSEGLDLEVVRTEFEGLILDDDDDDETEETDDEI